MLNLLNTFKPYDHFGATRENELLVTEVPTTKRKRKASRLALRLGLEKHTKRLRFTDKNLEDCFC